MENPIFYHDARISLLAHFYRLVFLCSYLIGSNIPTSLLVLMQTIFTPLVSVFFMECQLHIMKI